MVYVCRTPKQAEEDLRISQMLASIFPELESRFGKYPMKFGNWLYPSPTESDENGRPGFIPSNDDNNDIKEHYVYGSVTHQHLGKRKGYYHLQTKEAHIILNKRANTMKLKYKYAVCTDPYKKEAWKLTRKIVEVRSVSGMADDDYASNTRIMLTAIQGADTRTGAGGAALMSAAAVGFGM